MQHSPFYQQNLEALVAAKQPIGAWLAAQNVNFEDVKSRVGMNRWNVLDFRLKDERYMFETIPPGPLYQDWLPKEESHAHVTLVVGSNVGYGVNHVLSNTPNSHKVLVIEPDPEVLAACLGQTDYRPFFEAGKLTFLPPDRNIIQQVIRQLDVAFLFGKIYLRLDMPSQQSGPEYAKWGRICKEMLESLSVELGTLRRAQDIMVGNELGNFRRALADGTLNPLERCAAGVKAAIMGAGPSLMENGPKFAEMKKNMLVTSAMQTLPAMQAAGIKPDFCMAIDFSDGMLSIFNKLDKEWAKDIPLIYSTKVNPKVVQDYPGPTIPLWTIGGLATFIAGEGDLVLDAAGNVSVALMRLLNWMGINDIVLVGQDFAWAGETSHAEGHHYSLKTGDGSQYIPLKDVDGNTIYTTMQYLTSARDMDDDCARLKLNVSNVYGGGYVLTNATNVTVEELEANGGLVSRDGSMELYRFRMREAQNGCEQPVFEERAPNWRNSLRHAQKRMEKLLKKPEKNLGEIKTLLNSVHMFLRQDPVYMPYLYNEIMDVAGMRDAKVKYNMRDLGQFKGVVKRVLEKVRKMDDVLGPRSLQEHKVA